VRDQAVPFAVQGGERFLRWFGQSGAAICFLRAWSIAVAALSQAAYASSSRAGAGVLSRSAAASFHAVMSSSALRYLHNPEQADRDQQVRDNLITHLKQLIAVERG